MKIISRRNAMYAALIAAAISTAITTASAIATGATLIPTASAAAQAVSPRMADLIEMYRSVSANIDTLNPHTDAAAWTAAEEAWMRAEADLMNERPATVCDYAAKFDTLLEIDSSEGEYARLKRLSEDATVLGGCAK